MILGELFKEENWLGLGGVDDIIVLDWLVYLGEVFERVLLSELFYVV